MNRLGRIGATFAVLIATLTSCVWWPTVDSPLFSPAAGTYDSTQSVTIGCATSGAIIRYTLDGSIPSKDSGFVYIGTPIPVDTNTTIIAMAYASFLGDSSVVSATYLVGGGGDPDPAATPIWTDSFETTSAGSFPADWTPDANAKSTSTNYVDSSRSTDGSQSLRLFGLNTSGASWAALTYHAISTLAPFRVEFDIRNGSEPMDGVQPIRGGVGLREGTSWTNPARSFVAFRKDGSVADAAGNVLTTYSTDTWYSFVIVYERPSTSTYRVSYWINDVPYGSVLGDSRAEESQLNNLELIAAQGSVWYDHIRVYGN